RTAVNDPLFLLLERLLLYRFRGLSRCFRHYVLPVAFFLLATVPRLGPFRVRALVCVRWPRTGSPRRCRIPRYAPMSIRRFTFIETSRRRSPSTLSSRSMISRIRFTSSSVHAFTRLLGSTLAFSSTRRPVDLPSP